MSAPSPPSPSQKWACEYCTYENYAASKKCTLCRAPKPPQFIEDRSPPPQQDIYKMAPLVITPPPTSQAPAMLDPSNKWPCQACTYLNWPRAARCTQCHNPKASTNKTPPPSINVTNITQKTETVTTTEDSAVIITAPAPVTTATNPAITTANTALTTTTVSWTMKWACKACTYENWPRSTKCVLCGVQKGKTFCAETAAGTSTAPTTTSMSPSTTKPAVTFVSHGGSPSTTPETTSPSAEETPSPRSAASNRSNAAKKKRSPGSSPGSPASRSLENIEAVGGATASPHKVAVSPPPPEDRSRGRVLYRDLDWLWVNACQGVVEGDPHAVEAYLSAGGDATRQLTADECALLGRPRVYELNYTLVHLAIRYQREDMLAALLTATDVVAKARKRVPAHVAPDLATDILRELSTALRQRKGDFPCYFLEDYATFALPADIEDLPNPIKKQLYEEILDRGVQKELEDSEPVINWSCEVTGRLGSRLYALWNRTAGDCLLDSVLQATWGVMDRENTLRRALADSLMDGANMFYPRWKETEALQAQTLHFSLDESQWQQDWAIILSIASQPGSSLEQIHIFALAHILRRPIIVYGIKYVKSFRGDNLGLARFQGVYLPLLWERSFCWTTPISLGYTRGHFTALVPASLDTGHHGGAHSHGNHDDTQVAYLPLMDCEGKLLHLHFLSATEVGHEEGLLRSWLDVCETSGGLLVCQQRLAKPPLLVRQMVDEWLDRYRRLARYPATRGVHRAGSTPRGVPTRTIAQTRTATMPGRTATATRATTVTSTAATGSAVVNNSTLSSDDETDDE